MIGLDLGICSETSGNGVLEAEMWHRKDGIGDVVEVGTDAMSMKARSDLSEDLVSRASPGGEFVGFRKFAERLSYHEKFTFRI